MSSTFDRRGFLQRTGLASAGAVALTAAGARPAARAQQELAPFLHGVASGDPLADRVILWTRVTPPAGTSTVDVAWRVATDVDGRQVVSNGTQRTDASRDFTVKVDATGLQPGTTYYYVFEALGGQSLVGRTKTAPSGPTARARFGVVSCSNYQHGYFNAYARLAERNDLDAILHLGDYIYEYAPGGYGPPEELQDERAHEPPVEMVELAQYRGRYAQYRLDPDLRRLHQLFAFILVWDDHESTNDSWAGGAENHQPESEGPWPQRKAAAQRAYSEWLPIRSDDPARIYRSFSYGDLADVIMLDTRLEGRDEQVSAALEPTIVAQETTDPERELISEAQRTWLYGQLTSSTQRGARWRILGQQVMLMQWNAGGLPKGAAGTDFPEIVVREGGNALNADAWDGYVAERNRLYDHLEQRGIGNVVVLTGDIHTSWAADLPRDPYDPTSYNPATGEGSLGVEFVTPSITSDNVNEIGGYPEGGSAPLEVGTMADNPHIKYVDYDRHGIMVLDVTPDRVQADWFYVTTLVEPSDEEVTGPSWMVQAGQNHVEEAAAPARGAEGPPRPAAAPAAEDGDGGAPYPPAPSEGHGGTGDVDQPATPATGGGAVVGGLAAIGLASMIRLRQRGRQ